MAAASAASKAARSGKGLVVERFGRDAVGAREREPGGLGTIADDRGDAGGPLLGLGGAHERLHVGAPTGDQDHDTFHGPRV
jgi:hypothetical protein